MAIPSKSKCTAAPLGCRFHVIKHHRGVIFRVLWIFRKRCCHSKPID
ncbi:hypothetical protein GJA_3508 [Janthinobacterium agaricidamnosum NBRC 102515 = DSM 9628]|uniref:Uncharacterized protein n=1 Tax=Janthinobacterium agaricidamnosum NBRC 102515 = DSM 9628 TaxID=1349767 RepID=W0V5M0_9BURK|nr:hypothetical protein GJA_3508 [Janthinobacterium agaricidamnosum NBRC 102515 = DSM 9628]